MNHGLTLVYTPTLVSIGNPGLCNSHDTTRLKFLAYAPAISMSSWPGAVYKWKETAQILEAGLW